MAKTNKPLDVGAYDDLCRRVEAAAGLEATTAGQFEELSRKIYSRTGILLSPTTLKRIWHYIDDTTTPRRSTLDVLARFCGWRDLSDYESGNLPEIESGNLSCSAIRAGENINPGQRVILRWPPARVCEIEFTGGLSWKVVRSEGTRLSPGDTFCCPLIVSGEPLYLDKLVHADSRPAIYVCGRRSGVAFERI